MKLQRNGNLFSAYESADGVNWTLVGTDTIAMGTTVYVGLAVTSHTTGAAATCTFDNVTFSNLRNWEFGNLSRFPHFQISDFQIAKVCVL